MDQKRRLSVPRLIGGILLVTALTLAAVLLFGKKEAPAQPAATAPTVTEETAPPTEETVPPTEETVPPTEAAGSLPQEAPGLAQVMLMTDGTVAVLYTDGTVRVAGDPALAEAVKDWKEISKLYFRKAPHWNGEGFDYETYIIGLTREGGVVGTNGLDLDWKDVDELHLDLDGLLGVTRGGDVLVHGQWEPGTDLEGMTGVETLVPDKIWGDFFGCLKKDGSVIFVGDYCDPEKVYWTDVKELYCSGHAFYVIHNDGSVETQAYDDCSGLAGAVRVVPIRNDALLGLSENGTVLTHSGGNIYTNMGDMMVAPPGVDYYSGEIDIRQLGPVRDIVTARGIYLLDTDGTVTAISYPSTYGTEGMTQIVQLFVSYDSEAYDDTLYGLREDGSLVVLANVFREGAQVVEDYRGWHLQKLWTADGGMVGLTTDGHLVGDGCYADTDLSVLDP